MQPFYSRRAILSRISIHLSTFAMAAPAVKGSLLTYAAELECSEPDTRHWIHRWCIEKNGGQLALMPPILEGTGLAPTIPNVMRKAAEAHNARQCMGVRTIEECLVEGKKQFWRKGPFKWRTYADVYSDITSAAKGLYALCLLYTSPSPRDGLLSRMPSSA